MIDITLCTPCECELKELCYRYTCTHVNIYRQSYADFSMEMKNNNCEYFMTNGENKKAD